MSEKLNKKQWKEKIHWWSITGIEPTYVYGIRLYKQSVDHNLLASTNDLSEPLHIIENRNCSTLTD